MSPREAKHTKFALFCTPYFLRHGIEIFSDNSLPLDATVPFRKLKKQKQRKNRQIGFLKFHIQTGSVQLPRKVYRHKLDESSSIEFGLSCSYKIK